MKQRYVPSGKPSLITHTRIQGLRDLQRIVFILMPFLLAICSLQVHATIRVPDSFFAEQPIFRASLHDVTINCDMVSEPSGFIKAIVWSDNPVGGGSSPQAYIYAEDYAYPSGFPYPGPAWTKGHSDILALPSGSANPDVALAAYEDPNVPNNLVYQVVVTYTIGADLYVDVYDLLNVGISSFSINTTPTYSEHLSDDCNGFPHIDMWADGVSVPFISNYWSMHQFAVVFSEGSTAALNGYVNDARTWVSMPTNSPFPINEPYAPYNQVDTCMKPDVACQFDHSDQFMHIAYEEAYAGMNVGTGLSTLTYDYPNVTVVNGPTSQTGGNIYAPRIEAMGDYTLANPASVPPYQVAFSLKAGPDEVRGYNVFSGVVGISTLDRGSPYWCMSACVAAGPVVNHWFYPHIGDQQYTVGFYPWGHNSGTSSPPRDLNIYARNINFSNGAFANSNTYQVNTGSNNVDYHGITTATWQYPTAAITEETY